MVRSLVYLFLGTAVSFLFVYLFQGSKNPALLLYQSAGFGLGWAVAYFTDRLDWRLPRKMLISALAVALLLLCGSLIFSMEDAVPAVFKFSTVFTVYYLAASLRSSKSLRN